MATYLANFIVFHFKLATDIDIEKLQDLRDLQLSTTTSPTSGNLPNSPAKLMNKGIANVELNPEFLTKNGQKQFAILSDEEFIKIKELLEDLEHLRDLRDLRELIEAKEEEKNSLSVSLSEVKN